MKQYKCIENIKKVLLVGLILNASVCVSEDTSQKDKLPVTEIQRFTTVIDHIKNYYVKPVEDDVLYDNAIRGMLAGLDPHSAYLDEEEFEDLKISTSGKFGGLGIELTLEDGLIRVISPIDDTPAAKAGIKAGDLIIRLDDVSVKGMSRKEAVDKMRGKPGTTITLLIIRKGETKPLHLKVTREIINVKSVKTRMLDNNYAYIRISQFQSETGDELIKHLKALKNKQKIKGVILDLRNNPGGILDTSVQIADAFLNKDKLKYDGVIVYTKGRIGAQIKEIAHSNDLLDNAPIVVMINGGSASASEIVAGALQDHNRAIIVGPEPSFGKGSVQTILPLKDKRGLKLTTALYYTPAGRSIQATGIKPDILIENIRLPELSKDKENNDNNNGLLLRENDLQGHLENGSKDANAGNKATNDKAAELPLIYSDYQLYQALNILKGVAANRG